MANANDLETYNRGISLVTTQAYSNLPNGMYRIVSGGSTVTVTTSIDGATYYTIGTVASGVAEEILLSEDIYLKCTFSGAATLQRIRGSRS